ncbi:MAG: hypothetical protein J6Y23_03710 [Prevotella sp.]|nr:hypothetical protein [Prevotella sp.]
MSKKLFLFMAVLFVYGQATWAWDGSGKESDPYLVKNADDWRTLVEGVAGGESYSGQAFRLTADIDISSWMVGHTGNSFCGTFDGDGHTLTLDIGMRDNPDDTEVRAPFKFVSGATIRHLKTTGEIYTRGKFAAGIVGRVKPGKATHLFDCHSSVIINSYVIGDGSHGGLIAIRLPCRFTRWHCGWNSSPMP